MPGCVAANALAEQVSCGTTILEMELVSHSKRLIHAPAGTNALTYADTVLPSYVLLEGLAASKQPFRRSATYIGLGILYNWLRQPQPLKQWRNMRIWGLFQRLGLATLIVGGLPRPWRSSWAVPASCIGIWAAATYSLSPDPFRPFMRTGDSAEAKVSGGFDPEGALGTLTTAASMWFGQWAMTLPIEDALVTGLSLASFGYMIAYAFPRAMPINKPFWTPSYAFCTSGLALLKFELAKLAAMYLPGQVVAAFAGLGRHSQIVFLASAALDLTPFRKHIAAKFKSGFAGELAATGVSMGLLWAGALVNDRYF